MKLVALMIFAVLFQIASASEGLDNEVSNIDILSILGKILQRLDAMDTSYKDLKTTVLSNKDMLFNLNKNYKDLKTTVVSNKDMLFNLDIHVRGFHMKLKEVAHHTEQEQKEITFNTKSVKELAHRNEQLSELISVSLRNVSEDVHTIKEVLTEVLPGRKQSKPAESCSWIKKRSYCIRSGNFWIQHGDKSSLEYCKMDDYTPVTTPFIPTTVLTTQLQTTGNPTAKPGNDSSCKELKKQIPDLKSGTYNITVGGKTFPVICDMETDGGGWLMVGKAVVNNEEEVEHMYWKTIRRDDYTALGNVTSGHFLLSTSGLNSLYNNSIFNEIRFHCKKPYHGRQVDLKTNGSDILQWLLHKRSSSPKPPSCGTWLRLTNDTSFIGASCTRWIDEWWQNEIYFNPIFAKDEKRWYTISLALSGYYDGRVFCDDYFENHPHFSNVGEWGYFVR